MEEVLFAANNTCVCSSLSPARELCWGTGFTPVGTSNGGKLAATLLQHTRLYGFAELRPDIRAVDHAVAL